MEGIENFYLRVQANLKNLQANKLTKEKTIPMKIDVHQNRKETRRIKKLHKKEEKLRRSINNGYHKGVADSIQVVNKIFKEYFEKCSDD